jgi:hypothetical protein
MNTLHVETARTETTPGEFVVDGYRLVVHAEGDELDGTPIYQSRFANKAVIKAFVLLADSRFEGWAVTVEDSAVTDAAGKANLQLIADADRFNAIRQITNTQVDLDLVVDTIKMFGNNVAPADVSADPDPEADES